MLEKYELFISDWELPKELLILLLLADHVAEALNALELRQVPNLLDNFTNKEAHCI